MTDLNLSLEASFFGGASGGSFRSGHSSPSIEAQSPKSPKICQISKTSSSGSLTRLFEEFSTDIYEDWSIPDEDIDLADGDARLLGQGATGKVFSAVYQGVPVAVKVLLSQTEPGGQLRQGGAELGGLPESPPDGKKRLQSGESSRQVPPPRIDDGGHRRMVKDMAQEIRMACRLASSMSRHPNLVTFIGATLTSIESLKIVYELVEGHDFEQLMFVMERQIGKPWKPSRDQALSWIVQMFDVLSFLHGCTQPIIHRDVKPSNIMVTTDLCVIKLCDLGLCTTTTTLGFAQHGVAVPRKMTGKTGSFRYMAPEVMLEEECYSPKVDVYSATMVAWYMWVGQAPFRSMTGNIVAQLAARQSMRPSLVKIARKEPELAALLEHGCHAHRHALHLHLPNAGANLVIIYLMKRPPPPLPLPVTRT